MMTGRMRSRLPAVVILSAPLLFYKAQDWPQWRGANRDGRVTGFKAVQTWPSQLNQSFKITIGPGDVTPALVKDRLYVFTKIGNNGRLFCVNAANGQTGWAEESAFQKFGSLIDAGSVIIGLSSNSILVVLKPDGQKLNLIAQIKLTENGIYAHPILSGNKIYIKDNESLRMFVL